ncbi:hypothetical protein HMPREF3213_03527 [Heyndrickxia coagulans]|uniref:Uncharacterized protein n=1 Tax=Heyndrickxia coagulans TaxID=1398 RepID=A0A150K546_HEYCO|nr:hypothetical protein HMPREF3213_03527 [Heyndrickxia coagulans]KYC64582.1 hypothetical protein B4100_2664 [Heyndrickxia coagulans]
MAGKAESFKAGFSRQLYRILLNGNRLCFGDPGLGLAFLAGSMRESRISYCYF